MQCLALKGFARSKLAVLDDRLERHGSEIGCNTINLDGGGFVSMSRCLNQYNIHIHCPISQPKEQEKQEGKFRAAFPVVVSNEAGTSFFMWDGLYNKLMVPVQSSAAQMVAAMPYDAFSQAVVTGTYAESWNYWDETPPTPACPLNAAYCDYAGGKDQGEYYCIGPYTANSYELTNSYYIPRTGVTRTRTLPSPLWYHTWNYRYMTKPSSIPGTYGDVGMQPLQVRLFVYSGDTTRKTEFTTLTGFSWGLSSSYTYYGGKTLQDTYRSLVYYHSLFDKSLHSPVVAIIPETMNLVGIPILDSWRDVRAGGIIRNVGMNRAHGTDSVGGVIETDSSILVYEATSTIASLPVVYTGVSFTVTDDGTTHNDSAAMDADDETLLIGQILALTNQRRKEAGVPPLTINSKLTRAAQRHADDMATVGFLSHTGSDGSTAATRIDDAGYFDDLYAGSGTKTAENIAMGYTTAEDVMAAWMSSATHKANIEDAGLWDIGIAVSGPYFVQDFGYRSDRKYKRLFRIWGHQKDGLDYTAQAALDVLNSARATAGVPALMENMALWRAAEDTAQYGDQGLTLAERLSKAGYDMWVDKDYVTIDSYEQTLAGRTVLSEGDFDADLLTTDYVEASVGYFESTMVIIAGKVGDRWPGLAPVCTTGMDLYHFTHSDPVSATQEWIDSVPDMQDVESFRLPLVYVI
jgi:uncharacterized protein YkwD